jgi:putative ABC transport system permease protein
MIARIALRAALLVVAAAAWLVPAAARHEWTREWQAELHFRSGELRRRRRSSWRMTMDLVPRAAGSITDAAWLRRQFTLDAEAVHDAAHALRMLVKAPGFSAITLLVFAVGIGAATAIVSVADALFMRPLTVRQPERVMTVWQANRETGEERLDVAPANGIDWLARAQSFESAAMIEPFTFNLNVAGREPDYLPSARVTESFFDVVGTPVLLGRTFLRDEFRRGGPRVAIISHVLWTSRFGANPAIVGQGVRLDSGDAYTVVGVMPPGLELRLFNDRARRPEPMLWMPKQGFDAAELAMRTQAFWNVLGRLRPGVTPRQAQIEFDALSAQLASEYPAANAKIAAQVVPLRTHLVGSFRDVLPLLLGAAAILLTVACANVANLLLARGQARGREFAVRQALGASRARLVRQMLVESLLLASAGGVVGLALARWILDTIAALRPRDIALVDRIPIDGRAAAIACGVTLLAALVAGLAPSLQLSRPSAVSALKESRGAARRGLRGALVVAEIAAALVLALGAGLLVRSFVLIRSVDPGFDRADVSVVQVFASRRLDTPPKRVAFFAQALERVRGLPGVLYAGGVTSMPFGEARVIVRGPIAIDGRPPATSDDALVYTSAVTGDYFQAMGVPLLKGRAFDARDTASSRHVVLVSTSAARRFWPDGDPIGSRLRLRFTGMNYDAEVVGIVGDVRHESLDRPAAAEVFLPYAQSGFYALTLVARTAPGSPVMLQAIKEQVWAVDPLQSVYNSSRLDQLIAKTLTRERFNLFVLGGFALATLLLATAGVYGVMSFSTSQRTREFGVRLALGAGRGDIVRLVLREGLALAVAGVTIGIALALPLARLMKTLLFGVTTTDPVTFVSVSIGLVVVAAAACYVPARRALRIDPVTALRLD